MSKVSAIVFHESGVPHEVAKLETIDLPAPLAGEVRVRLLAAPINPADLNVIEGKYPTRPPLPGVPGVEGVGVVEEIGAEVASVQPGDRVLWPHGTGSWRAQAILSAEELRVVPADLPVDQLAMLRINPPTALRMLRDFVALSTDDWILQNAGNSGVGRAVIQIAKARGLRTVSLVRRAELVEELRAIGGDVVLQDREGVVEEIESAVGRAPLRLALNGVGGESALRLAKALSPSGTVVTYGAMGRQPLRIPNGLLIFKDLCWRGFWVSHWYRRTSREEHDAMFAELFPLLRRGLLYTPVERVYPLEEVSAALQHAAAGSRKGKILFGAPELVTG